MRGVHFLVIGLAGLVVVVIAGGLGFRYIPSWYRPLRVPARDYQVVRNDLTGVMNELSARMVEGRPFDYSLTQDQLNRWLSSRMAIWPGVRQWVPEWLEDPVVIFRPDRVILAGVASWSSIKTVASLHLSLDAEADGLRVSVRRVQAGFWPIAIGPLKERIASTLADAQADRPASKRITVGHLFGEQAWPNRFVWFNGKVPFRVTSVTAEEGRIRLRFEPEPKSARR